MLAVKLLLEAVAIACLFSGWLLARVCAVRSQRPAHSSFELFLLCALVAQLIGSFFTDLNSDPSLVTVAGTNIVVPWLVTVVLTSSHKLAMVGLLWVLPIFVYPAKGLHSVDRLFRAGRIVLLLLVLSIIAGLLLYLLASFSVISGDVLGVIHLVDKWVSLPLSLVYWTLCLIPLWRCSDVPCAPWFLSKGFRWAVSAWIPFVLLESVLRFLGLENPASGLFGIGLGLVVCQSALGEITKRNYTFAIAEAEQLEAPGMFNGFRLSPRENEIARLLLAGHTNKEIAQVTGLSYGTVKNHISAAYAKMGIGSRYELHKFSALEFQKPGT